MKRILEHIAWKRQLCIELKESIPMHMIGGGRGACACGMEWAPWAKILGETSPSAPTCRRLGISTEISTLVIFEWPYSIVGVSYVAYLANLNEDRVIDHYYTISGANAAHCLVSSNS